MLFDGFGDIVQFEPSNKDCINVRRTGNLFSNQDWALKHFARIVETRGIGLLM